MKSKRRPADLGSSELVNLPDGGNLANNLTPAKERVLTELDPAELPGMKENWLSGFWPAWQATRPSQFQRPVSRFEPERAGRAAGECSHDLIDGQSFMHHN